MEDINKLHAQLEIPYAKSADAIWQEMEEQLPAEPKRQHLIRPLRGYRLVLAASVLLLFGSGFLIRFYSKTFTSTTTTANIQLPDGSVAYLNTGSRLSYYPLWWSFSRELKLSGEAYFEVKKGKKFSVRSHAGITTVMGTSFDIYARGDTYRVTCLTGRVQVVARKSKQQVILNPNNSAEVERSGDITYHAQMKARASIAWKQQFIFTHSTLQAVVESIEKRYNVQINLNINKTYYYSGIIPNQISIEEALNLICKPFGFTFVRKSAQSFEILQ